MSVVLAKVSKQTGIAILYDQELANKKVTGDYKALKASDVVNRLFAGLNKSIRIDKGKKVVFVKTFGAKDFIWAGEENQGAEDVFPGNDQVNLGELHAMQVRQYIEFQGEISDENEVIENGLTRAQLRDFIRRQNAEFLESLKDDDEILEGGMTRAMLRTELQQQLEIYRKGLRGENILIADGRTRGQLRAFVLQQLEEFDRALPDDNVIMEGNLTRGQLKEELRRAGTE